MVKGQAEDEHIEIGEDGEAGDAETGDGLLSAADDASAPQPSWAVLHREFMRNAGAGDAGADEAGEPAAARDGARQANGKQAR